MAVKKVRKIEGSVLVDGSNVLWSLRDPPSLEDLLGFVDYLEENLEARTLQVFLDASTPHLFNKHDKKLLEQLKSTGKFQVSPAGVQADNILVDALVEGEADYIVSNDLFREYEIPETLRDRILPYSRAFSLFSVYQRQVRCKDT